jgi:hypothetical protein
MAVPSGINRAQLIGKSRKELVLRPHKEIG